MKHAILAVLAGALAAGCMQTTVKSSQARYLTADEVGRIEAERRAKGEAKPDTPAQQPTPRAPRTLEQEIARLRDESTKDPTNPRLHFLLGAAYEKQSPPRLELAEIRYREGAKFVPAGQYTGPHFLLGRVLARQGRDDEALVELDRTIAIKPPDVEGYYLNEHYREAHLLRGAILYKKGDLAASERSFKSYLKYGGDKDRVIDFFPKLVAE